MEEQLHELNDFRPEYVDEQPVIDDLVFRMAWAQWNFKVETDFICKHDSYMCCCGARSGIALFRIRLHGKVYVTDCMNVHRLIYHRSECSELDIIRQFPLPPKGWHLPPYLLMEPPAHSLSLMKETFSRKKDKKSSSLRALL